MKGIHPKDFNRKIKPSVDFFTFVSGGWIQRNPIPSTETRWGSFPVLHENNQKELLKILKESAKKKNHKNLSERQIGDFFFSAMNVSKINKDGIESLQNELNRIDLIKSGKEIPSVLAHLHSLEAGSFFWTHIEPDDKKSSRMIVRLYQHGLGMPDRDYYIRRDKKSLDIKNKYLEFVAKLLKLARVENPMEGALKILEIETRLAHASKTKIELRDAKKMYNQFSMGGLKKLAPDFSWDEYFRTLGIKNIKSLIVSQPKFIKETNAIIAAVPPDDLKIYLKFHLINGYAGYLSEPFEKTSFGFYGTVLSGVKKMKPRWKRAIAMVDESIGMPLGKLYVEKYFPLHAKKRMMELIENVRVAFRERIKNLDWMSAETKRSALKKLSQVVYMIGYPDKWRDFSKLKVTRDSLIQNVMNAAVFESEYRISKLGKPVDRTEWYMTPPTVNAYYDPNKNQIVFPAGILQEPFFSDDADDAVNYGAIGSVIGHELTHGFDDQGCLFDGKGNMRNWWTKKDKQKFDEKAEVLVKQFDAYVAVDDVHINGKLTLGENIADLGGLTIAYDALQRALEGKAVKKVDGFTPEQRFFIGYAITERGIYRPEKLRQQVLTDPHSPAKFRVNGPASNTEAFYEAFGCQPGDALYRPEAERAKIW